MAEKLDNIERQIGHHLINNQEEAPENQKSQNNLISHREDNLPTNREEDTIGDQE